MAALMRLNEYLNAFSVDDLRELASRRGIMLSPEALKGRQTLVNTLAGVLGRYDTVYSSLSQLNQAELSVLRYLLQAGARPSASGLAAQAGVEAAAARRLLEELRLWGLVFPEGDWEHIVVPSPTQMAAGYLNPFPAGKAAKEPLALLAPALEPAATAKCESRPGSLAWDLTELLARVARARMKLTQAGRINRRDLKAMEPAFGIKTSGYSMFLFMLGVTLALFSRSEDGILGIMPEGDQFLAQPEATRTGILIASWEQMRAFPESMSGDPADADYVPMQLPVQRNRLSVLCAGLAPQEPVTLASLGKLLQWSAPLSFQQWDSSKDPGFIAARMVRSLYWLGVLALDDPEKPKAVMKSALGTHAFAGPGAAVEPALVPEEPRFFLQPNAEIFAPPNLAPYTLFHLRRITGEKKGGAAGMYPLSADSIRRGLDSGLTTDEIITFLERYSRTGLPENVRAMVQTAGRQHGRIRLVPAGYVMVTDEPALMQELRSLKTVDAVLGDALTERVAEVDTADVPELLRRLRGKGYAPLNVAETGDSPPLPNDPDAPPKPLPQVETALRGYLNPNEVDWDTLDEEGAIDEPRGEMVTGRGSIRELLIEAEEEELEVELEFRATPQTDPEIMRVIPLSVGRSVVDVVNTADSKQLRFALSCIQWARLTGESYEGEYL